MSQYNNKGYPNQTPSDEIDLREVFRGIGNFFSRIGKGFINLILAVRRATFNHKFLIITTIIVFTSAGIFWFSNEKDYFSSNMIIESEYYDRDLMDGAVSELNSLAEQRAYEVLEKKLNISNDEASNIRKLKVETVVAEDDKQIFEAYLKSLNEKTMSVEELVEMRDKLIRNTFKYKITVEVFSADYLQNVQKGLIHYLENNEYVERRVEVEKENLIALKGKFQEERAKLDALKRLIAENFAKVSENGRTGSNNVILGSAENGTDPLNVYKEDILIYKEELEINRKLALIENVEVIKSFTAFTTPANIPLWEVIIISILIGLGAAYIIIILLEINKALNRFEQEMALDKKKPQVA